MTHLSTPKAAVWNSHVRSVQRSKTSPATFHGAAFACKKYIKKSEPLAKKSQIKCKRCYLLMYNLILLLCCENSGPKGFRTQSYVQLDRLPVARKQAYVGLRKGSGYEREKGKAVR